MVFSDDYDIEVLDLEETPIKRVDKYKDLEESNEEVKKENSGNKKKIKKEKNKPKNKKVFTFQVIFCSVSLLFILGCCFFYGSRLFKYYRIYNPKADDGGTVTLLSNEITSKSEIVYEESGLYINSGNYIYKGDVSNNYLRFNNMLWRIVKINKDDTIDIILDDYINVLNWDNENKDYINSNVYDYLNNYFLKNINKDMLNKISVCTDKFDNLTDLACNNVSNDNYVSLLDVSNFLNSVVDSKSYLVKDSEIFWLSNQGSEKMWHTNGVNVSISEGSSFYEVRPFVTLKATTILYEGDGTKEKPYIIENKNQIGIGSYVKLGEDLWTVYSVDDNIKLSLASNLDKQYHFSYNNSKYDINDKDSLAEYLNTIYLDSLSYKDIVIESDWYNGILNNSYKDILKDKVKAKVGILNIADLKFDSNIDNYLLMTSNSEGLVYTYGEVIKTGKSTIYRNIRPCISISKNIKIESGKGSLDNPYILEV